MSEQKKNTDLRILRTRKFIKESFLQLLKEKDYQKITVDGITEKALISRNTFYLHYPDKEALLKSLFTDAFKPFRDYINQPEYYIKKENPTLVPMLKVLIATINQNLEIFSVYSNQLTVNTFSKSLANSINKYLGNSIMNDNPTIQDKYKLRMYCDFVSNGITGIVARWLKNYDSFDSSNIVSTLEEVSFSSLVAMYDYAYPVNQKTNA